MYYTRISDAGRWKTLEVPVLIGGDNLPSPIGIGLTDLPNIGGHHWMENMDKGLTVPKWMLINRPKIPQNFSAQAQKFVILIKIGFIGRP